MKIPAKSCLLLAVLLAWVASQFEGRINLYQLGILIDIGIAIVMGVSLNLVTGYTGQFSLGHAGFMGVGAYVSASITVFLSPHWLPVTTKFVGFAHLWLIEFLRLFSNPHWLIVMDPGEGAKMLLFAGALVAGGLGAALAGLLVGVPSLRLKGDYLAIVTLGFGEIIRVLVQNADVIGGARGFSVPPRTTFFTTYIVVALTVYVVVSLVHSTYGRGFLTVRDDEIAAEAMGINTTKYKVIAFVVAAFFAGVAGGLYAHFKQFIHPEGFGFLHSVDIVVIVILGGMGSTPGVIMAAILLTLLPEGLRTLGGWDALPIWLRGMVQNRMILYSLLLIVLMLTRPQGLFSSGGKLTKWLKGRAA